MLRRNRKPYGWEKGCLFEDGWKDQPPGINWDGEEAGEKNTAWSVLEMYFSQTRIKANEMPEAVEVPVECCFSKHSLPTLISVLNLVRAGGRIVDFKSTGKTPDPEDAAHQNEVQMSCYSVLYREATGHQESGSFSRCEVLHRILELHNPSSAAHSALLSSVRQRATNPAGQLLRRLGLGRSPSVGYPLYY